jgi:hypothetical protein
LTQRNSARAGKRAQFDDEAWEAIEAVMRVSGSSLPNLGRKRSGLKMLVLRPLAQRVD